jgi:hypothetical protein
MRSYRGYAMKKWSKALTALAVLLGIFAFSFYHTSSKQDSSSNYVSVRPAEASPQSKLKPVADSNILDKNIETKMEVINEPIPFQTITQNDSSLNSGTSKIKVAGLNGVMRVTYRITYVSGVETKREKIAEVENTKPINQVMVVGRHAPEMHASEPGPAGATALCVDGFLSYAKNHEGACSRHGGVSLWYQ